MRRKTLSIRTSASNIYYIPALTHQQLIKRKRKRKRNIHTQTAFTHVLFVFRLVFRVGFVVLCCVFFFHLLLTSRNRERIASMCVCADVHEYRSLCKRSVLLSLVSHRFEHAVQSVCNQLRVSSYALNVVHFVKPIFHHSSKFYRLNRRVSLNYIIKIISII